LKTPKKTQKREVLNENKHPIGQHSEMILISKSKLQRKKNRQYQSAGVIITDDEVTIQDFNSETDNSQLSPGKIFAAEDENHQQFDEK